MDSSSSSTSSDSPDPPLEPSLASHQKSSHDALYVRNKRKYSLYMKTYPHDVLLKKLRYNVPGGLECEPSSSNAAPRKPSNKLEPSSLRAAPQEPSSDCIPSNSSSQGEDAHEDNDEQENIRINDEDNDACTRSNTTCSSNDVNVHDFDYNDQYIEGNNNNNRIDVDNESGSNSDFDNDYSSNNDGSEHYDDSTESNDDSDHSTTDDDIEQNRPFSSNRMAALCLPLTLIPNVTAKDILLITIAIAMRHHLTHEATLAMLIFANSITVNSGLPTTKKALWRCLSRNESIMTRHMYCRKCIGYIGKGKTPKKECPCKTCGPTKDNRFLSIFIQLNLESQLKELLATPGIAESLRYRFTRVKRHPDAIEDIYDGAEYKKKCLPGSILSSEHNFSFTINTDGCKVSNSSNASAWPVLLTINELPPHARKKHMLLAGVWVDVMHPTLNSLLLPIVTELQHLYEEGVVWKPDGIIPITSKFVTLICSVDSIARPSLLNMTQFNGMYGCSFCYAPGCTLPGRGPLRTYPVEDVACRTDQQIRTQMNQAFDEGQRIFGVKGPSVLMLLPEFDLALGVIVESMHNLYLGVTKQVTELILFGKADEPWYAGSPRECALIDERLMKIRPPSRISRKPRVIKTMKQWKASEWRNWLLYYCLSCLEGIVKKRYLDHLALLSRAAYTLNKDSISLEELRDAQSLLTQYLQHFQDLFRQENMSFNVHLLTHVADTVKNWGPLWAHSAFPFESWNKRIIDAVTSANSRPLQIVTRFLMARFVDSVAYDLTIRQETRDSIYLVSHGKKKRVQQNDVSVFTSTFHGLGKITIRPPCNWESESLRVAGYECQHLQLFKRARINDNEYRVRGENEKTRFCNTLVRCEGIGFGEIVGIVHFVCNAEHTYGIFIERLPCIGDAFGTGHIKNLMATKNVVFVTVDNVGRPALTIDTTKGLRGIAMPNVWETD